MIENPGVFEKAVKEVHEKYTVYTFDLEAGKAFSISTALDNTDIGFQLPNEKTAVTCNFPKSKDRLVADSEGPGRDESNYTRRKSWIHESYDDSRNY